MCVILSTVPAGKVLRTPHQGAGLRGTTETFTVLKMGLATLRLGTGDQGLGTGDRGLGTGDRGPGTGDWGLAGSASARMDEALHWAELCTTHFSQHLPEEHACQTK